MCQLAATPADRPVPGWHFCVHVCKLSLDSNGGSCQQGLSPVLLFYGKRPFFIFIHNCL